MDDVLHVLGPDTPERERETVHALFNAAHENRFSGGVGQGGAVLSAEPVLTEVRMRAVLDRLEARL